MKQTTAKDLIEINGTNISAFESVESAARNIHQLKTVAISVNAEVLINNDYDLTRLINKYLGYPDGIGVVLAAKFAGYGRIRKIAGVELWMEVLRLSEGKSIFLVGAKQEVLNKVVNRARTEYPKITIVGAVNGYFSKDHESLVASAVIDARPDIVVLAMGQPYQEKFAEKIFDQHNCLILCVGGSFDVYAGLKKRAPKVFINFGLEWLYRLLQEPSRFVRYAKLIKIAPFLGRLFFCRSSFFKRYL